MQVRREGRGTEERMQRDSKEAGYDYRLGYEKKGRKGRAGRRRHYRKGVQSLPT